MLGHRCIPRFVLFVHIIFESSVLFFFIRQTIDTHYYINYNNILLESLWSRVSKRTEFHSSEISLRVPRNIRACASGQACHYIVRAYPYKNHSLSPSRAPLNRVLHSPRDKFSTRMMNYMFTSIFLCRLLTKEFPLVSVSRQFTSSFHLHRNILDLNRSKNIRARAWFHLFPIPFHFRIFQLSPYERATFG